MRPALIAFGLLLSACVEEPAPEPAPEPTPAEPEGQRLGVPPALLARAREEASGLSHLTPALQARALEGRIPAAQPGYGALRRDPAAHAEARVALEGRVGLARPAGEHLWIVALMLRRDGERWVDPIYVLSVVPPPDEGAVARAYGWVVGERTIGRHALPLVLAYALVPAA